jgi:Ankyrin repeats (3 copies)
MNIRNLIIVSLLLYSHALICCVISEQPICIKASLYVRRTFEDAIGTGDTYTAEQLLNIFGAGLATARYSNEAFQDWTLAEYAVRSNRSAILKLLLEAGAHTIDSRGQSLLFRAVQLSYGDCVQVLLANGYADPNVITIKQELIEARIALHPLNYNSCYFARPVSTANLNQRLKIAQALLDHGANLAAKDSNGHTAIEVLDQYSESESVNQFKQFLLTYNPKKKLA